MAEHRYLVGLVGAGVGPSLTPAMHMREAAAQGVPYDYRTIDIAALGLSPAAVGDLVRHARLLGYDALNITHPCKQLVLEHLDRLDPAAARLGAVNTVVFEDGEAVGYNTDTSGFAEAVTAGLPQASVQDVVQLGAGGAGTAVADALLTLGTEHLVLVDVDEEKSGALAHDLAARFPEARIESAHPDKLPVLLAETDGLVHCTPTGMADHPGLPLDPRLLHNGIWVADIVYRPLETALLRAARDAGCSVLHGGYMAVYQAVDAFALITGLTPDPGRMLAHLSELAAERG